MTFNTTFSKNSLQCLQKLYPYRQIVFTKNIPLQTYLWYIWVVSLSLNINMLVLEKLQCCKCCLFSLRVNEIQLNIRKFWFYPCISGNSKYICKIAFALKFKNQNNMQKQTDHRLGSVSRHKNDIIFSFQHVLIFQAIFIFEVSRYQRCKKGWSTGALLPEGNRPNPSWQKDSGQVYRTCRNFYKKGYLSNLCSWIIKNRFFSFAINLKD